ncbi:MAG: 4Fe-4S binding protein [Chloroflexota bacterium]|nr:4Fe-4S binding protein [Chloroflexota bacterium]
MMNRQTVWIDVTRCTGCGACVEVCPAGAIGLVDGKARVDEESCTGCGACVDACAEGAIQLVVQGELVPAPVGARSPRLYRPSPLAETAGAAVVVAGTGLLMKTAGALSRAVGRWLTRRSVATRPSAGSRMSPAGDRDGTGRQRRHRRRGGRR